MAIESQNDSNKLYIKLASPPMWVRFAIFGATSAFITSALVVGSALFIEKFISGSADSEVYIYNIGLAVCLFISVVFVLDEINHYNYYIILRILDTRGAILLLFWIMYVGVISMFLTTKIAEVLSLQSTIYLSQFLLTFLVASYSFGVFAHVYRKTPKFLGQFQGRNT